MKLVYKKLEVMWLNTKETLQATTTFIKCNKYKDTRLQTILRTLEIFCFPFIKKMIGNAIYSLSVSLLHALSDEWSGEWRAICENQ